MICRCTKFRSTWNFQLTLSHPFGVVAPLIMSAITCAIVFAAEVEAHVQLITQCVKELSSSLVTLMGSLSCCSHVPNKSTQVVEGICHFSFLQWNARPLWPGAIR